MQKFEENPTSSTLAVGLIYFHQEFSTINDDKSLSSSTPASLNMGTSGTGLYTIGGLDWWTGLVDWTTGLIDFHLKRTFRGSIMRYNGGK